MQPINLTTAPTQQTQVALQTESASKTLDIALKVAGVALGVIAVGVLLSQTPVELVIAGIVLAGFVGLTCLCIASIDNLPAASSSAIYASSYRPLPWAFSRSFTPVFHHAPRTVHIPFRPSFRAEPMPARGIDPRPMREPVGIRRRQKI